MSLRSAVLHAREHRAEIIFGTLTGLMSSRITPAPVQLPRRASSLEPATATHFGQTIPQDTTTFIDLVTALEDGVDAREEFDHDTATLLFTLGSSFRRHGFLSHHFEPLSTAICNSVDRYVKPTEDSINGPVTANDVKALKDVAYLACSIMAQGCAEAEAAEGELTADDPEAVNPITARAKILEIEKRNAHTSVVRMQIDPPLMYAAGEPLMIRTPYTPLLWRPMYSAMPSNPNGMLELHVINSPQGSAHHGNGNAGTREFSGGIVELASVGDEWIISPQPINSHGAQLGLHSDDPTWREHADKDIIVIAEDDGLATARALVLQQVFGVGLGFVPGRAETTATPGAPMRRIHLVWGAHNPGHLYELQGLLGLARGFDWLRLTPVVEQFHVPAGTEPSAATGLPEADQQRYTRNSLLTEGTALEVAINSTKYHADHVFIVAGSTELTEKSVDALTKKAGVPEDQILRFPTDWTVLSR